jgi:glycogen operon protein
MNMSDNRFSVPLPHVNGVRWFRAADTALSPPDDILEPHEQIPLSENSYTVQPRSVVVLEAR